jgi:hypothetical protein
MQSSEEHISDEQIAVDVATDVQREHVFFCSQMPVLKYGSVTHGQLEDWNLIGHTIVHA